MPADKDCAKGDHEYARPSPGTVQGEGDYEAARNHGDAVREFVEAGEVQKAAHDAAPKDQAEAGETKRAEQEGLSHSKGEAGRDMRRQGPGRPQGN